MKYAQVVLQWRNGSNPVRQVSLHLVNMSDDATHKIEEIELYNAKSSSKYNFYEFVLDPAYYGKKGGLSIPGADPLILGYVLLGVRVYVMQKYGVGDKNINVHVEHMTD